MALIKVILGSTRPKRFGEQPARWLMDLTKDHPEATFELVDLKEVNLPFLDEEQPALFGNYQKDHTKAWAKVIDAADGFVFVTAEYNLGVPAPLKNAIDFLAAEWRYKPAAFVSYGASAGGARAVQQLREIAGNLDLYTLGNHVSFVNYWTQLDDKGQLQATEEQTAEAHKLLKTVAFWADALKAPRAQLAAQKQA